ncbi:tRNA (adenosine(37)-N6)-threonylcarbamoyltransferase complex ATPase subunit type 1 TsaE [Pseudomonas sp. CGJS7]|uniref:tRNA (adenosine(37)-N6)-threonylcarbamoyltransferase complex ATPase subunit type 1 TsaE n=1 Tax=Pseudomonas sp. CGJS7 TaxID=3109348 RepID=UPI0030083780
MESQATSETEPASASLRVNLADPDATDALGAALAAARARLAPMPTLHVHLRGDLGAGKSSLARALLRALGVSGAIRSPTYTLVERYPLQDGGEAWHLDLYRIGDAGELEFLGLDGGEATLWLIEWPERGQGWLPAADLRIDLAVAGAGRQAEFSATSPAGRAWLNALASGAGAQAFAADS